MNKDACKYLVIDFGEDLDDILNTFVHIMEDIHMIISDYRPMVSGVKTKRFDEVLMTDISSDIVKFVTTDEAREINILKLKRVLPFNISSNFISINEFLISELKNNKRIFLKPQTVRLEASTICQLNCVGCYMRLEHSGTMGTGYLRFEDYKNFIISNPFIKRIELANSGEVFLNPDLGKIIQFSADRNVRLTINSGCNLNTVSKDVLEIIVKSNIVDSISVSIDGASQKTYAQYRRNGVFENVINNIRLLNAFKKLYSSENPKLYWQYILFAHNEQDVQLAKKMALRLDMEIKFKLDWGDGFAPVNIKKLRYETGLQYFSRAEYNSVHELPYYANRKCKSMIFSPQINYDGRLLGCCSVYCNDWGKNIFQVGLINALNSKEYMDAVYMVLGAGPIKNRTTPCGECSQWKRYKKGMKLNFSCV